MRLVDYEIAAALSEIYGAQDEMYGALQAQTVTAIFTPDTFDPARRRAVVQMILATIVEAHGREGLLKDIYRKHLPLLRAAAGE